jgi:hypothetical protein
MTKAGQRARPLCLQPGHQHGDRLTLERTPELILTTEFYGTGLLHPIVRVVWYQMPGQQRARHPGERADRESAADG